VSEHKLGDQRGELRVLARERRELERTHDGVPQEVMVSIAVSMRESPKSLTLHRQCSPTNKLCCNPHPNNH
jgi:hypothetical protein